MELAMDRAIAPSMLERIELPERTLDEAGVRAELERHHAESYGWALACCAQRREDAENVLQIAYLKVLSGRARFDGRARFKTWLFSVIRLTAAAERRTAWFHRLRVSEFFTLYAPNRSEPDGEQLAALHQMQTNLRRALRKLPPRQREVLQLVFYHDLSIQEAARVMGIGVGSARRHYERGKKQLQHRLGGRP